MTFKRCRLCHKWAIILDIGTVNFALLFVGVLTEWTVVDVLSPIYYGPVELVRFLLVNLLWR